MKVSVWVKKDRSQQENTTKNDLNMKFVVLPEGEREKEHWGTDVPGPSRLISNFETSESSGFTSRSEWQREREIVAAPKREHALAFETLAKRATSAGCVCTQRSG